MLLSSVTISIVNIQLTDDRLQMCTWCMMPYKKYKIQILSYQILSQQNKSPAQNTSDPITPTWFSVSRCMRLFLNFLKRILSFFTLQDFSPKTKEDLLSCRKSYFKHKHTITGLLLAFVHCYHCRVELETNLREVSLSRRRPLLLDKSPN